MQRNLLTCIAAAGMVFLTAMSEAAAAQTNLATVQWEAPIEVAAGGGHRGPWRMNDSDYDYVDDPTVAIGEEGRIAVAWADQVRQDIFFQSFDADGRARFAEPVRVSDNRPIFSWLPRMAVAGDDVYVLWQEIVFSGGSHGGEIFFARSTDGGASFGEPLNLSNTIAGAGKGRLTAQRWDNGSLDLAIGPQGALYAAWTEYEGRLWVSRSTDRGGSFSAPVHVAGDDREPARGPSLAVAPEGAVHLAWTVGEDAAADIRVATSFDDAATFGPPTVIAGDGHADAPEIAVDGNGIVHLVYAESREGPLQSYRILHARSEDGGRSFTPPREIAGPQPGQLESVGFPTLRIEDGGNVHVAWELFPNRLQRPRGLGFAWSADGGRSFAPPEIVPGTADPALGFNGSQQGLLMRKLAVGDAGAIAIVNSTFRHREASRIWLHRGRVASN